MSNFSASCFLTHETQQFADPDVAAAWIRDQARAARHCEYAIWTEDRSSSCGTDLQWDLTTWLARPGDAELVVGSVWSVS